MDILLDSPRVKILADIGNSKTKIVVVTDEAGLGDWSAYFAVDQPTQIALPDVAPTTWMISSVNRSRLRELREWIAHARPRDVVQLVGNSKIPLPIDVQAPDKVGTDRLLAAFGATQLAPRQLPIVIVNLGTAITVDYVDGRGRFQGGLIFPGAHACFQTLHSSTDQLPLVFEPDVPRQLIGKNTQQAISSGVWQMQIGAIQHIVGQIQFAEPSQKFAIFVAGGGAPMLAPYLNKSWKCNPDLVLIGIQAIDKRETRVPENEFRNRTNA